jgi:hypothetical protein
VGALAAIVISAVLGVGLAVGAAEAFVQTNGPDNKIKASVEQSRSGNAQQPEVVLYGQR